MPPKSCVGWVCLTGMHARPKQDQKGIREKCVRVRWLTELLNIAGVAPQEGPGGVLPVEQDVAADGAHRLAPRQHVCSM